MEGDRPQRLGGLGAVLFLAGLAGIAFYAQSRGLPDDRDRLRKPATSLPEISDGEPAPVLAWRDRLDLGAAELRSIGTVNPRAGVPANATPPAVDPSSARFVQDLGDGHRILFTLDPVLQEAALTIFRNREVPFAGAVVLDLRDNAVLALAGHSTMDPQVDPLEIVLTPWAPAASTFKLVTAAALLESEEASPTTRVCYHGGLQGITDDLLQDSPSLDTECATLSDAVADSLNVVIGKLARRHLEPQELGDMSRRLLFQADIPFEFRVEPSPAHIPDDAIARAKVAAGFWHADMSPLHGALLASIVARGGIYQPPHVVTQVLGPADSDRSAELPAPSRALGRTVADQLAAMMLATTTGGTARNSFRDENGKDFVPGVAVAGKTGSLTGKRSPQLNYNWFIGFAPAESPEIAFAVLLANESKWRIKAHYAARRLIQLYVERRGAIREQREVRLSADGLLAPGHPKRDSATIAAVPRPAEAPSPPSPAPDVLPPVPGPLPKG